MYKIVLKKLFSFTEFEIKKSKTKNRSNVNHLLGPSCIGRMNG